jgi:hypothetical protein
MNSIETLLEQVKNISQKYDEIVKITGENFNVFKILDVEANELCHSKILTTLLDPKGSHDCGDTFLKKFFQTFITDANIDDYSTFDVYKEYSVGDLGRMDIFIDCGDFGVAIENKIYAGLQPDQLKRYKKFLDKHFKKEGYLVYLMLCGDETSEQSQESIDKYKCLSYKDDILKWLELCQKEVYNKPIIRETLEQYIILIKILTNQTRSKNMFEEIVENAVKSPENVKAVFAVADNIANDVKRKIMYERFVPAIKMIVENNNKKLAENDKLELSVTPGDCLQPYWGISLENEMLKNHRIRIRFEFSRSLTRLSCGFAVSANDKTDAIGIFDAEDDLRKYIADSNLGNHPIPPYWLFYEILYQGSEYLSDLVSEESKVVKKCEEKIISLLVCINGFKL